MCVVSVDSKFQSTLKVMGLGGSKLIVVSASPSDRPYPPAGCQNDTGWSDRPTLCRAQCGKLLGQDGSTDWVENVTPEHPCMRFV